MHQKQAEKIEGSVKNKGYYKFEQEGHLQVPPATIHLRGQDYQGKVRYPREFVPLAACAESKTSPGMEAPKQRVVLCASKWESNSNTTEDDLIMGEERG